MNVNRLIINFLLLILIAFETHAQTLIEENRPIECLRDSTRNEQLCAYSTTKYDRKIVRYQNHWSSLVPNKASLQFAGDIGMYSMGIGWEYGKRKWETYFLIGYVPKRETRNHYLTFTLKEIYSPWNINMNHHVSLNPFYATIMFNTIVDDVFWVQEPNRYPKGYYSFSSKIRIHIGIGQKFVFNVSESRRRWFKEFAIYYELSTCELYIRQKILNKDIPLKDILCAGIGVQYTIF